MKTRRLFDSFPFGDSIVMKAKRLPEIYVLVLFYCLICRREDLQVAASGVFEIRLDEFVNEGGREQRGNCCEGVVSADTEVCSEPCKTSFRICFSHYRNNVGSDGDCTFGYARTPVLGDNSIISGPSQDAGSSIVKMNFNFTWPRAFSLVIEATHQRGGQSPEKLIARMEKLGSVDANTDWKTETQTQQEKILRYSYRVRCDQYYFGDDCSKYCRPRDDMFGHWKCDRNGEKVCLPGWRSKKGSSKSYCLEPICLPGCNSTHGYCRRPNECICRRGWKGTLCDRCRTYPGCQHGTCLNSFECNCDSGWGGMFCNHDLNYCTNHKPCRNGARCTNAGQGSFFCECTPGFTGRECEVKMNECDPNPCMNGAKCTVHEFGYICECPDNYFGPDCGRTHLNCDTTPCRNGGTCVEEESGYQCRCRPGFGGVNCEMEEARCPLGACLNGGTCHGTFSSFTCSCPPGFHGSRCQNEGGKCESATCMNGGRCSSIPDGYRCECATGYSGPRCEITADPCASNPCENGGTCEKTLHGYVCNCASGFTGLHCGNYLACLVNPCKNDGKCVQRGPARTCICAEGYHGKICEKLADTANSLQQTSFGDGKNTKIIVLTKNEKSGLNTAQWITVCFASAFLLLIFIAVAVCVAYQRYGKTSYTGGRAVKPVAIPNGLSPGNASRIGISPSHSQEVPSKAQRDQAALEGTEVRILPTRALSPTTKYYFPSKSTEFLQNEVVASAGVHERSTALAHKGLCSARSQSDVRCSRSRLSASYEGVASHTVTRSLSSSRLKKEESSLLPTYQEACSDRHFSSRVV